MATAISEEKINVRSIPLFDTRVKKALTVVTTAGAKHRVIDGSHVFLYGPEEKGDGTDTLKVSASRPTEETLQFIDKFVRVNGLEISDKEKTVVEGPFKTATAEAIADAVAAGKKSAKGAGRAVGDGLREAAKQARKTPAVPDGEWVPHIGVTTKKPTTFITNGKVWKCTLCEVEFDAPDRRISVHAAQHQSHTPEADAKQAETKAEKSDQHRAKRALRTLAEVLEIDITGAARDLERMTADRDRWKTKCEEAEARLALMREALRA